MGPFQLSKEYERLRASYDAGQMSEDALISACQDLVAEDDHGQWWSMGADGQLLKFNNKTLNWVEARWSEVGVRQDTFAAGHDADMPRATTPDKQAAQWQSEIPGLASNGAATTPDNRNEALTSLMIVFVACLAISIIGWDIMKIVPKAINSVIPTGGCQGFSAGSVGMYFCSAFVGLRVVFGSLVLAVVLLIFRKPIMAAVNKINKAVPPQYRSIMPAVIASVFFAIVWSGSHYDTGHLWGILPHRAFPAIVGVMVHVMAFYGPAFMERHSGFFDARDRLGKKTRWILVFSIPTLVSLLITFQQRVSNEAFKQQFVVIVGMTVAYLLMTPRSGKLSDLQHALRKAR